MIVGRDNDDPDGTFTDIWAVADGIPGWLTDRQAKLLHDEAQALAPGATIVEIGSHQGRSTVVLADAARSASGSVVAVDPFVEGRLFGGITTRTKFLAHLDEADVADVVTLVQDYSSTALRSWSSPVDLLYVDGKHDVRSFLQDLQWRRWLRSGGSVLVHDAFSSIGVTLGILTRVLFSRDVAYERREGSLALFRKRRPTVADRVRILREVPWWLRNVGIKILLRLRLRRVAALVGHHSPYDPY